MLAPKIPETETPNLASSLTLSESTQRMLDALTDQKVKAASQDIASIDGARLAQQLRLSEQTGWSLEDVQANPEGAQKRYYEQQVSKIDGSTPDTQDMILKHGPLVKDAIDKLLQCERRHAKPGTALAWMDPSQLKAIGLAAQAEQGKRSGAASVFLDAAVHSAGLSIFDRWTDLESIDEHWMANTLGSLAGAAPWFAAAAASGGAIPALAGVSVRALLSRAAFTGAIADPLVHLGEIARSEHPIKETLMHSATGAAMMGIFAGAGIAIPTGGALSLNTLKRAGYTNVGMEMLNWTQGQHLFDERPWERKGFDLLLNTGFSTHGLGSIERLLAEHQNKRLDQLIQQAESIRKKSHSDEPVTEFMQKRLQQEVRYVPEEVIDTVVYEAKKALNDLPSVSKAIESAHQNGGLVKLGPEELAELMVKAPEVLKRCQLDLTTQVDGESLAEIQQRDAKGLDLGAELREKKAQHRAELSEIQQDVNGQLAGGRFTPSLVRQMANLHVNAAKSLSFLTGKTPLEIWKEHGVTFKQEIDASLSREGFNQAEINKAKSEIQSLIEKAQVAGNTQEKIHIAPVKAWLVKIARDAGLEIEGFKHSVDTFAIRHIQKAHGNAKTEQARGQLPITEADFAAIPEIIANPDKIMFGTKSGIGRDQIVYLKKMGDGSTLYLEEILTGRNELAAKTIRKHPATMNEKAVLSTLFSTSETLPRIKSGTINADKTSIKVIDNPLKDKPIVFEQPALGWFEPVNNIIRLTKDSDISTVIHESHHYWLELMRRLASEKEASKEIKAYMQDVLTELGIKDLETWNGMSHEAQRPFHEQFAEAGEHYFYEGKAPTKNLAPLFAQIKEWMRNVYREGLREELSENMRQQLDRLFAAEDAIQASNRQNKLNVSLTTLEDSEASKQATRDRLLEGIDALEVSEAEARRQVVEDPIYVARESLSQAKPEDKFSTDEIRTMYPENAEEILAKIPHDEHGKHPDEVAEIYGFNSGDELITVLKEAPSFEAAVNQAKAALKARHPELMDTLHEAQINETKRKEWDTEYRDYVSQDQLRSLKSWASQVAEHWVNQTPVGKVHPRALFAAVVRAHKSTLTSIKEMHRVKTQRSIELVKKAIAQHLLRVEHYRQALQVMKEQLRFKAWVKRSQKKDARKKFAFTSEVMDLLLENGQLKEKPPEGHPERPALKEILAELENVGNSTAHLDLDVFLDTSPYAERTVDQARRLEQSLRAFKELGEAFTAKAGKVKQAQSQKASQAYLERKQSKGDQPRPSRSSQTPRQNWIEKGLDAIESIGSFLKGEYGEDSIPYQHYLNVHNVWHRVDKRKQEVVKRFASLCEDLLSDPNASTEYAAPVKGGKISRWGRIMIAMHWGNKEGRARLLGGEGRSEAEMRWILDQLTKEDIKIVNELHAFMNEVYQPEYLAILKKTGTAPKLVEAIKTETEHGSLTGGYSPIKYHADLSKSMNTTEVNGAQSGLYVAEAGHNKGRVAKVDNITLLLDPDVIVKHLEGVVHSELTEPCNDVIRLFHRGEFSETAKAYQGADKLQQVKQFFKEVGEDKLKTSGGLVARVLASKLMWLNPKVALYVVSGGVSTTIRHFHKNVVSLLADPLYKTVEVEASAFMENRRRMTFEDAERKLRRSLNKTTLSRWAQTLQQTAQSHPERFTSDALQWLSKGAKATESIKEMLVRVGEITHGLQNGVEKHLYKLKYVEEMRRTHDPEVARIRAERFIEETQGGHSALTQALIQRKLGASKIPFWNWWCSQLNIISSQYRSGGKIAAGLTYGALMASNVLADNLFEKLFGFRDDFINLKDPAEWTAALVPKVAPLMNQTVNQGVKLIEHGLTGKTDKAGKDLRKLILPTSLEKVVK